jgi:hypothetical protein
MDDVTALRGGNYDNKNEMENYNRFLSSWLCGLLGPGMLF